MAKRSKQFRKRITVTFEPVNPLAFEIGNCYRSYGELYEIVDFNYVKNYLTADVISIDGEDDYYFCPRSEWFDKIPEHLEPLDPEIYKNIKYYVFRMQHFKYKIDELLKRNY